MFAFIEGRVDYICNGTVIVSSNGVGYEIFVSNKFEAKIDDTIKVYTYMIHKEDCMILYGFNNREEKKMFSTLISVSGVGPKLALEVLSVYSINDIMTILFNKDINMLKKVPGMGLKKAEKLLFELRDKIEKIELNLQNTKISYNNSESDVIKALISLGFSNSEALKSVSRIEDKNNLSTEEIIGLALKNLSSI